MPIEENLIRYAAPTLAGCKVANLMNLPKENSSGQALHYCRQCLQCSGIQLHVFLETEERRLLYVYRCSALEELLKDRKIQAFLHKYGYRDFTVSACLKRLTARFAEQRYAKKGTFPHEIGIFLGYPLDDVEGFILHQGKHAKLSGDWKVYGNVSLAKELFSRFADCRSLLRQKFYAGASLTDLSVAG